MNSRYSILIVTAMLALVPLFSAMADPNPSTPPTIITLKDAVHRAVPNGKAAIKVLAEGLNAFVGHLVLAPNAVVPLHRDPTEEYIYIIRGSGDMTINGKTTTVRSGTMVYMPKNAEVTYKNGPITIAIQIFADESAQKYRKWPLVTPAKHVGSHKKLRKHRFRFVSQLLF